MVEFGCESALSIRSSRWRCASGSVKRVASAVGEGPMAL